MHLRSGTLVLLVLIVALAALAGCSSPSASPGTVTPAHGTPALETSRMTPAAMPATTAAPGKESIAAQLASVQSANPVFREAYRMFSGIRETQYVHPPYTDDDLAGIYKFDCLGFVDHVLMNATPASYTAIGKGVNPSIESYSAYFSKLDPATPDALGWTRVDRPIDLEPGDVCLWLKPSTLDTGHLWIIAGQPSANPKRPGEVLVRIFDSSVAHSDDSRTGSAFPTGLGSGILGFMVDANGDPVGLYWEGGVSTSAGEKDTTIVCGRLNTRG